VSDRIRCLFLLMFTIFFIVSIYVYECILRPVSVSRAVYDPTFCFFLNCWLRSIALFLSFYVITFVNDVSVKLFGYCRCFWFCFFRCVRSLMLFRSFLVDAIALCVSIETCDYCHSYCFYCILCVHTLCFCLRVWIRLSRMFQLALLTMVDDFVSIVISGYDP